MKLREHPLMVCGGIRNWASYLALPIALIKETTDVIPEEQHPNCTHRKSSVSSGFEREELMGTVLLVILVLLLVGALPTWPYSSGWGYYPSGGLGLILLIVILLLLMGRI